MSARRSSPAQLYALVFGVVLVALGIAGFFWSASFATGIGAGVEQGFLLGVIAVNGWHNVVHIVTGLIGLAVARDRLASRAYALGLGALYLVITLLGFIAVTNDTLLGLVAINLEDNFLHLAIGVAGVGAGLATRPGASSESKAQTDTEAGTATS
jgi:hypothetical protein